MRRSLGLVLWLLLPAIPAHATVVSGGVLDLTAGWDGVLRLDGAWAFFPSEFIDPKLPWQVRATIEVPGSWGSRRADLMPSHQGFASYRLRILLPQSLREESFGLFLPQIGTAFRLYANGKLVSQAGVPSHIAEASQPEYRRHIVYLDYAPEIILTFHVSNYHEAIVGGLWNTPEFGRMQDMLAARNRAMGYDLFLLGAAFIFAIYHLGLFSMRREDLSPLAFAVFCMAVAVRIAITGERVMAEYIAMPWATQIRIEYASIYLSVPAFAWFVHTVYPQEYNRWVMYGIVGVSLLFLIHLLFTPPIVFALYLRWMHAIILASAVWILYGMALVLRRRRLGGIPFTIGTLALVAAAINDIIANNRFQASYILPVGILVFLFGQSAILAIRFADAYRKERELSARTQRINRSMTRFVPDSALRLLGYTDISEITAGTQRELEMAVLFADIRNFTAMGETMTSQETFNFLNAYLNRVGPVIRRNNGFIDKYMGDGIMALFPDKADDAMQATLEIMQEIQEYNRLRSVAGYAPLAIGVGISYGKVAMGTLGEAERIDVTVVSDTVNLAARLQEMSRRFEAPVIVSEKFFQQLNCLADEDYRLIGQVRIRGKKQLVTVFEIIRARSGEDCEALRLSKGIFERGIHHYWNQEYARAEELFNKALYIFPADKIAELYLMLCRAQSNGTTTVLREESTLV